MARTVQHRVHRVFIHGLKSIGGGSGLRIPSANPKIVDVIYGHRRFAAGKNSGQSWSHGNRAKCGLITCKLPSRRQGVQGPVQPAVFGGFEPRRARLHVILGVKVRAGRVRGSDCVNNREMLFLPQREECIHSGMQSEKPIQIEDLFPRNVNAGPHRVVRGLGVGNDDVEPVRRSALENHDEPLALGNGIRDLVGGHDSATQERG